MRWMSWNRAPSPKKQKLWRAPVRVWQPELLEPRLALSHAPLTDYGTGPGQDSGNPSPPLYSPQEFGSQQFSNAAPASNGGSLFGSVSAPSSAPPPSDNCGDPTSVAPAGFGGPNGQAFVGSNLSPPPVASGQDDAARFVGGSPVFSVAPSPAQSVCNVGPSAAVVSSVISSSANVGTTYYSSSLVPGVVYLNSSAGPYGGSLFAPPQGDDPAPGTVPSYLEGSNAGAVHSLVASAGSFAGGNNASSALTFGLPAGGQPAAVQPSQVVVSTQNTTMESPKAIAPNPSALGAVPGDVIYRGPASESLNGDFVPPLQELPRAERQYSPAPAAQYATNQTVGGARESIGFDVKAAATPLAIRGTLIAGMAPNFEALDRALEVALKEIENMGGDLVVWLDEPDNMAWAAGGALVVLAGGGYYWQRRRASQRTEGNAEELSHWLFTHLYNPTGRP